MDRHDAGILAGTLGSGLYLWLARPALMAALLIAFGAVFFAAILTYWMLVALGLARGGAKRRR